MYDLAVIGVGPAGQKAIEIALENNLNVIAFEMSEPGGTCLNVGCIPTKSILHCSSFYDEMKKSDKIGINCPDEINFDWEKILNRKTNIVSKFTKLLNADLSKKITFVKEKAELFIENDEILICANDKIYKAKNIILATGSKPKELPGLKFDSKFILNSDDLYNLEKLPKKIAIIGSGAIGLEWAMIMAQFDVEVKLIEKATELAPGLDIDIQKRIERILKLNKIQFFKNDFIKEIKNNTIILNSDIEFDADCVLCAVGRDAVLPRIFDKNSNNEFKLQIFDNYTTNLKNIYVAGDALNKTMLAHSAYYDARCLIDKILFNKEIKKKNIPSVIYISPQIASVGLKEQDIENKDEYIIKKVMVSSIAKSWCDEAIDGFIKVIIKDDKIKGAHIVAKEAVSLVSIFNIFIDLETNISDIKNMIFPHPSFEEAVLEVLKID